MGVFARALVHSLPSGMQASLMTLLIARWIAAAKNFLLAWPSGVANAYDGWEQREFPHGDGI